MALHKVEPSTYTPRFDFTGNRDMGGTQTATIKDLMNELVYESTTTTRGKSLNVGGMQMSIRQLEPVLRLLRSISGKALKSISEEHPIADIKTIKTLYNYSYNSGTHLISLLEPPGHNSQAILNILTSSPTKESETLLEVKRRITSVLETDLSAEERESIGSILGSHDTPHVHWRDTNEAIDKVLLTRLHIDNDQEILLKADAYLIEKTKEFMSAFMPMKRDQELYLATHTHLRALEFMHHLQFEITTNRAIPNDRTINNMQIDFSHICKNIPPAQGVTIQAHTPFMSLSEVPAFCIKNASEVARLVSAATGFTYNKRDILTGKDATRALVSLAVYLALSKLPSDENPNPIGIVHIVAAFCSVLHQRKMKSKPMTSRRYSSRLISPQKQLDAFIARKEKKLSPAASFIYGERTLWYTHALLGRAHATRSHRPLQTEQAKLLKEIYSSLDPARISELINAYRDHMVRSAHDYVAMYGRAEAMYEWVHGLRRE